MPTLTYRPEIFVFGSNMKGIHGAGSALYALKYRGAILGQGVGLQGQSYALATCFAPGEPLSLIDVQIRVDDFIAFAKAHPDWTFKVTQVGCGYAGHTKEQIAPMFKDAPENCSFDSAWAPFLGNRFYWGTF